MSIQIRNTPGIGVFITRNRNRGIKIDKIERATITKIIKEKDGLSRKALLDIINDQSEQIIRLNQVIDDMKKNRRYEEIRGNCDPPDNMTIHKGTTKSNDIEVSQR